MNTQSGPPLSAEDLANVDLVTAIESAIGSAQECLTNLAAEGTDAKWSVSDLFRLVQLRDLLRGQLPRRVTVRWVDDWADAPQQ